MGSTGTLTARTPGRGERGVALGELPQSGGHVSVRCRPQPQPPATALLAGGPGAEDGPALQRGPGAPFPVLPASPSGHVGTRRWACHCPIWHWSLFSWGCTRGC